eukprot:Protomagalhaensia_sp_Gyna_25__129@NODE_1061_length_2234_cov_8_901139_g845_i0_p3_GENE_NODE_1061_length_2234_cov_8_901139_g845_i0NODE_1061_length_2234_cov_8_901139_g845_i0_p3_ORF_typecomplete_len133_score4_87_NODE_1061_length_2234_cov_8_901139_g845_i06071005
MKIEQAIQQVQEAFQIAWDCLPKWILYQRLHGYGGNTTLIPKIETQLRLTTLRCDLPASPHLLCHLQTSVPTAPVPIGTEIRNHPLAERSPPQRMLGTQWHYSEDPMATGWWFFHKGLPCVVLTGELEWMLK